MVLAYFHPSAYLKLLVDEDGSEFAAKLWDSCDAVLSSRLSYPEIRSALAAAHRNHEFDGDGFALAEQAWENYWVATYPVELTAAIERRAGELAGLYELSGTDSVHLASALAIGCPDLVVALWNRQLYASVVAVRLCVTPRQLNS